MRSFQIGRDEIHRTPIEEDFVEFAGQFEHMERARLRLALVVPLALALMFALLVGTFFGVQPARRAARLHPVEALR